MWKDSQRVEHEKCKGEGKALKSETQRSKTKD